MAAGVSALRITSATKADAVYQELRTMIIDGRLRAGSRLDQFALAADLGVSTTPLREALRRLETEHLAIRSAHKAVIVASLSNAELNELYQVRIELDAIAVAWAARYATPQEINRLRRLVVLPYPDSPLARLRANRTFHFALFAASHNGTLVRMLESLWDRIDRYRFITMGSAHDAERVQSEHALLLDAVANHKPDLAVDIAQRHVHEWRDSVPGVLLREESGMSDQANRES